MMACLASIAGLLLFHWHSMDSVTVVTLGAAAVRWPFLPLLLC